MQKYEYQHQHNTTKHKIIQAIIYVISIIEHHIDTKQRRYINAGLFWYLANIQRFNSIRIPREGAHYQMHVIILFMNVCCAVSAFIFVICTLEFSLFKAQSRHG